MTLPTMGQVLRQIGLAEDAAKGFDHIALPFQLNAWQPIGLHYTLYYRRAGLFFEPRTGKSIVLQMNAIWHAYRGEPTAIVMPGALFYQFTKDFNRLTNHGLLIAPFNQGPALRARMVADWEGKRKPVPHVLLMTRDIFK
ncbi:MAG: hypothetical protein EOM24_31390, partial [Chloroflexia bacterium]|nr:hypothetical protein [Chloroflexia bacterium]